MKFKQLIYILLIAVGMLCAPSCVRDDIDSIDETYEEGRETYIKLRLCVPSMNVATRAEMPEGADYDINSLWVGIFSAKTGLCTYAGFRDEQPTQHGGFITLKGIKTLSGDSFIVAVANPVDNRGYLCDPSGKSNESSRALDELLPASADAANQARELWHGDMFTWQTYQNLVIRQLDAGDINTPIGNLVMSGIYFNSGDYESDKVDDNGDPKMPSDWETANQSSVRIPASGGTVSLPGAIHLRRLISQVKFTIQAGDYNGDDPNKRKDRPIYDADGNPIVDEDGNEVTSVRIIEVIPQSYQVRNVPYTSWLHERRGPSSVADITNATYTDANSGDIIRLNTYANAYGEGAAAMKANYRSSAWFNGSQYITSSKDEDGENIYSFDFWMLENKRWASYDLGSGTEAYDKREKEYKEPLRIEGTDDYIDKNQGLYRALCGDSDGDEVGSTVIPEETMNNCAALVEIRCRILYTDNGLDAIRDKEDPRYPDYEQVQYRSADVIYTVHLGGIHANWNDFTHRRNHKYTYKIKIIDIDRIIVEALREEDEPRPGIEGVVTDVINPPFDVDCHYGVVNIKLSNRERTGDGIDEEGDNGMNEGNPDHGSGSVNGGKYKDGLFPFRIRFYDKDNFAHFIDQSNIDEFDEMYWNWIELRPAKDSATIADYKPFDYDWDAHPEEAALGKTFRLTEVHDIAGYPGQVMWFEKDDNETRRMEEKDEIQRWYTLFINEYVYEKSLNEDKNDSGQPVNNWVNYVNLSPRMCWLNTLFRSSKDDESNYIRSKYVVRQESIQTFYALPDGHENDAIDAIGMERSNETFGFNLRWDDITTRYSTYTYEDVSRPLPHDIKNNNGRHNTLLYIGGDPLPDNNNYTKGSRSWYLGHLDNPLWTDYVTPNTLQLIKGINSGANQNYKEAMPVETVPYYVPAVVTMTADQFTDIINGEERKLSGAEMGTSNINTTYYLRILDACMNRNRDNNGDGIIDIHELRWYVPASSEIVDIALGYKSLDVPLLDYDLNKNIDSPTEDLKTEQRHQSNTRFHYATSNQRVLWAEEGTTINPEIDYAWRFDSGDGVWKWNWNLPPQQVRCVRALGTNLKDDSNDDLSPAFEVDDPINPTKIKPTYYEQKNLRAPTSEAIEPHQETSTLNRLSYNGFEFSKKLYEFEPMTVRVWVVGEITYPEGWYANGIQDNDHYLGVDEGGLDPEYIAKHNNPRWSVGKHFGQKESWYKALPDTWVDWNDSEDKRPVPVLKVEQGWWDAATNRNYNGGWYAADFTVPPVPITENRPGDGWGFFEWAQDVCNDQFPEGYYADNGKGEYLKPPYPKDPAWESKNPVRLAEKTVKTDGAWETRESSGVWTDPYGAVGKWFVLPVTNPYATEPKIMFEQFITDHGTTLAAANQICQKYEGRGWRLPSMKEAALIKIALENAGIYMPTDNRWWDPNDNRRNTTNNVFKYTHPTGYELGNFLSSTYREFGIQDGSTEDYSGYYTGVYYPEIREEATEGDYFDANNLLSRICCITTNWNRHYYIRCVRDLPYSE